MVLILASLATKTSVSRGKDSPHRGPIAQPSAS